MDDDNGWRNIFTLPNPTTCSAFDPTRELIWLGNQYGQISSVFPSDFSRYTSCKAHSQSVARQILAQDKAIYSVGADSVKAINRRGLTAWNVLAEDQFFTSIVNSTARGSDIIVGCASQSALHAADDLLLISAGTGSILRKSEVPGTVSHLARTAHGVVSGSLNGSIALRDPRSLAIENSTLAHIGGLTALEGDSNLLLSIGYTLMQGRPVPEPLVKVWDIRTLRPLMPVNVPAGPSFVKSHPRLASTVIITTQRGQFQLLDLNEPAKMTYHQIETLGFVTSVSVSATGEGLLFSDSEGAVHLWASSSQPIYSRQTEPIELPDSVEPPKRIDWNDSTPLNLIGVPHYTSALLSNIPYNDWLTPYTPCFNGPAPIDPIVLQTMRMVEHVGYAANPKSKLRNQAHLSVSAKSKDARKMDVPLFRSQQTKNGVDLIEPSTGGATNGSQNAAAESIPKHFRRVEIQYSKFGVEDFDFGYYNKTQLSGLETHIANSYTNALLQVLNANKIFNKIAVAHTCQNCVLENCLLCESGFLFKMLADAKGANCQASNLSRAFSAKPHAEALGLIDNEDAPSTRVAYSTLIRIFHQFLLDQMAIEAATVPRMDLLPGQSKTQAASSVIGQLFGMKLTNLTTCPKCNAQTNREGVKTILELSYPRRAATGAFPPVDFLSTIKSSIIRENVWKSQCSQCRQGVYVKASRRLTHGSERDLPCLLAINAGVKTADHLELWQDKNGVPFLVDAFRIQASGDKLALNTCSLENIAALKEGEIAYELTGFVAQIQTEEGAHLVAIAKLPKPESPSESGWYLFNDFLVCEVDQADAFSFKGSWKIPAVLYYQRVDAHSMLNLSGLPTIPDRQILFDDISISHKRNPMQRTHTFLQPSELVKEGMFVSIDAEFVSLQQEEVEAHSDGTRKVIRPSRMSLARVSVLRAQGPQTGVPFIDDYIHTLERITDYLTEFSGIKPGDLDPFTSRHTLVPLKVAYKKLRLLVDLKCVFVGHGLAKDFRIINIFVPPEQVIDTVNIYHLPARHRKLSLRFLSWVVLNQDIQSSGTHDSIEDARTALQLYEEYQRLDVQGLWEERLDSIYREGKRLGFKAPGATSSGISPMPLPVKLPKAQSALGPV